MARLWGAGADVDLTTGAAQSCGVSENGENPEPLPSLHRFEPVQSARSERCPYAGKLWGLAVAGDLSPRLPTTASDPAAWTSVSQ